MKTTFFISFPKKFEFVSLCSFICLQAVYQLSGPLLGVAALHILLLSFTSRFVIDFLSIRKFIILSAIAIGDRHPLWSRSVTLTLANGCNPTTSFAQAFQHASSNDIHSRHDE